MRYLLLSINVKPSSRHCFQAFMLQVKKNWVGLKFWNLTSSCLASLPPCVSPFHSLEEYASFESPRLFSWSMVSCEVWIMIWCKYQKSSPSASHGKWRLKILRWWFLVQASRTLQFRIKYLPGITCWELCLCCLFTVISIIQSCVAPYLPNAFRMSLVVSNLSRIPESQAVILDTILRNFEV